MKLRTSNLNGFNHVLSDREFNKRVMLTFALYKNDMPAVWALQEVPSGGKSQPCIKQLQSLALQYGYEVIMPEPVEGFAKEIFNRVIADTDGRLEIVENSVRFSFESMKNVLLDFGIRSMSQKGIIFPYWENVARAVEDVCSVIWLIQVTTGLVAILFFIVFVYIEWKKHKPNAGDVVHFLSYKKDCFIDAVQNRRNRSCIEKNTGRKFKRKEKEGVKNEKKVD